MSKYEKVQNMHQYYRDVFSQELTFPDCGKLPHDWIESILVSGSCDTAPIVEKLFTLDSGLPHNKDLALKLMLVVISQANLALDRAREGRQDRLPQLYLESIRKGLVRVLTLDPNGHYAVMAAQLLYRIGEIDEVLSLVGRLPRLTEESPTLQMILAMIFTVNEDYESALPFLVSLVEKQKQRQYPLISLMGLTCTYKLGEMPDSPIDFSTLRHVQEAQVDGAPELTWLLHPRSAGRTRPTVLVACDDRYFFEHAIALIYSLHETNRGELLVHLHLYDPNPSVVSFVKELQGFLPELEITATCEAPTWEKDSNRVHFASRRFVVADQLLRHFDAPVMVVDADSLFREKWSDWAAAHDLKGEVITSANEFAPFWEKIPAGFLYLQPGDAARQYIGQVARFIQHNLEQRNYVWFLDQVALSVCFDATLAKAPPATCIAGARLIDSGHQADALSWVITTIKDAEGPYSRYRKSLLEKYGQLQLFKPDDAFRILSERKEQVYFLQVGAMDGKSYDPIYPYVTKYGWKGILVEPLPDMVERLKLNYKGSDGLIFENVAISEKVEQRALYRVSQKTIDAHKLPDWLKGMSTFSDVKLKDYQAHVEAQPVSCVPLRSLMDKHCLPRVDVLQIDTEGFDYRVFKQFDFSTYRPAIVNIEVVNLKPEELNALQGDLAGLGYIYFQHEMDLMALDLGFFNARIREQAGRAMQS